MCSSLMGSVPNDPLELRDIDCCTWAAVLFFALPVLPLLIVAGAVVLALRWVGKTLRIPVASHPTQTV